MPVYTNYGTGRRKTSTARVRLRPGTGHIRINDRTIEGVRHRRLPAFSVQYHPEASAGPHDSSYLFGRFRALMGK